MKVRPSNIPLALTAILFLTMASAQAAPSCAPPAQQMARTELLFGAGVVSAAQWKMFLVREVTPRFPDGLTAIDGTGQWKRPDGRITAERSHILLLWHAPGADSDRKIDAIRAVYKKQFHQLSVMRVDGEGCVSF
jgi:Protein of unknown function (DUF3574)